MAIASVGTIGTGVASTAANTFTLTITVALASGDFAIASVITDNIDGSQNVSATHTGASGGTGKWTKLGEMTNPQGAALAGITNSLWLFESTGTNAIGTVFTFTMSSTVAVDKVASMWKFTKAAGTRIVLDFQSTRNPVGQVVNAANGFGSAAFSGLTSASRLYFRGLGKEVSSTSTITVSTGFTAITSNRSRNNTSAVWGGGEFRINTSTGETSNPTFAVSGDAASVFVALKEVTPLTTTPAADDFADGTIGSQWVSNPWQVNGMAPAPNLGTVVEQNGRLEIAPVANFASSGALVLSSFYNLQGKTCYVKLSADAFNTGVLQSVLIGVGSSPVQCMAFNLNFNDGNFNIYYYGTAGSGGLGTNTVWDPSANAWIAIRVGASGDNNIYLDYADDSADPPTSWTNFGSYTIPATLDPTCMTFFMHTSTYGNDPSPHTIYFDGFNGSTGTPVISTPAAYVITNFGI